MPRGVRREFAYQGVYRYLETLIVQAALDPVGRLPSLRDLAQRLNVSISTVQYAYTRLEHEGRVRSVPKSGYFVYSSTALAADTGLEASVQGTERGAPLACDLPMPAMPALDRALLAEERRLAREVSRGIGGRRLLGEALLRNALAVRHTRSSRQCWSAEDVYLAPDLQALLETLFAAMGLAGSSVVVASPCCRRILQALQRARVRVVELPLDEQGGADPEDLGRLLSHEPIRLALLPSCLSTPSGQLMPVQSQQAIGRLLDRHQVWLLENDLDSDHCFNAAPVSRMRDWVDPHRLLVFGSLEATMGAEAPYAYLLGRDESLRRAFGLRAFRLPPLRQQALGTLFARGEIDTHLHALRGQLVARADPLCEQVTQHLGGHLSFTRPLGGRGLWTRLNAPVENLRQALRPVPGKILFAAPGELFCLRGRYRHHLLLAWAGGSLDDLGEALELLGAELDQQRT
ncbi:PLP-dependent aminotransferase family protein [Pseudomonas capeferrum]|uniref:aminotransferase-like domain-containing protein n=1 Tax=Pseudomonas capeferrum TaxID=1495066 RepID=UPI0015E39838|nr:PLP-dependent aminotransferase family protein [Pseudomonas capeferrum]MBA1203300.1 PLP-dependent aminotransferase family protein [Pseudomonas capeferrum]